jgi:hypothetical protein
MLTELLGEGKINKNDTILPEILFRGRNVETGEMVVGNYHHNIRKGIYHTIAPKDTNEPVVIYRESLQLRDRCGEWNSI